MGYVSWDHANKYVFQTALASGCVAGICHFSKIAPPFHAAAFCATTLLAEKISCQYFSDKAGKLTEGNVLKVLFLNSGFTVVISQVTDTPLSTLVKWISLKNLADSIVKSVNALAELLFKQDIDVEKCRRDISNNIHNFAILALDHCKIFPLSPTIQLSFWGASTLIAPIDILGTNTLSFFVDKCASKQISEIANFYKKEVYKASISKEYKEWILKMIDSSITSEKIGKGLYQLFSQMVSRYANYPILGISREEILSTMSLSVIVKGFIVGNISSIFGDLIVNTLSPPK